jgi:hypothetical protein
MHQFESIAGNQFIGCIPVSVKTDDGEYRTAIDIADTSNENSYIVLFKKEDNKLTILNPSDIIDEPTTFVVVDIDDKTLELCAKEGLIDIANWLLKYGHEWNHSEMSRAAKYGNIEFAKWAYENGCKWDDDVLDNAAGNVAGNAAGNIIEFVIWARDNECSYKYGLLYTAAYRNNIELAKWALKNGCSWDDECPCGDGIIGLAVYNGQL